MEVQRGKVGSAVSGKAEHQESGGGRETEADNRASAEEDANRPRQERGSGRGEEALARCVVVRRSESTGDLVRFLND
jgi:hypothetical protein